MLWKSPLLGLLKADGLGFRPFGGTLKADLLSLPTGQDADGQDSYASGK